jgi:hypothetical protein
MCLNSFKLEHFVTTHLLRNNLFKDESNFQIHRKLFSKITMDVIILNSNLLLHYRKE